MDQSGTRAGVALIAVLLASCTPLNPALLQVRRAIVLAPGESVHLVLIVNDAAIAQADFGITFGAIAAITDGGTLDLVPDDPRLEDLVVIDSRAGGTSLGASIFGGDVPTLCAPDAIARTAVSGLCEIGVTLTLGARAAETVQINFGVMRDGDRGTFGSRGPVGFDGTASVFMRVE